MQLFALPVHTQERLRRDMENVHTLLAEFNNALITELLLHNAENTPHVLETYKKKQNPVFVGFKAGSKYREIRNGIGMRISARKRIDVYRRLEMLFPEMKYVQDSCAKISTAGYLEHTLDGICIKTFIKPITDSVCASTVLKETLPMLIYQINSNTVDDATLENLSHIRKSILIDLPDTIVGETSKTLFMLKSWLSKEPAKVAQKRRMVNQLNDAVSQAKSMQLWQGYRLSRGTGVYTQARQYFASNANIRADKVSPADIYMVHPDYTDADIIALIERANTLADYSSLFATYPGERKPLVGISLKDADAMGGKGREKITSHSADPTRDCLLSVEERAYDADHIRALGKIDYLRDMMARFVDQINTHSDAIEFVYAVNGYPNTDKRIVNKFASLKMVTYTLECQMLGLNELPSIFSDVINYALGTLSISLPHFILVGGSTDVKVATPFVQTDPKIVIWDQGCYGGVKILVRGELHGKVRDIPLVIRPNGNKDVGVEVEQLYFRNGGVNSWQNTKFDILTQ